MIFLASSSPRRRELLEQIGVSHQVVEVRVDEALHPREAPELYVVRLALAKAQAGHTICSDWPVLGADTAVVGSALFTSADPTALTHQIQAI